VCSAGKVEPIVGHKNSRPEDRDENDENLESRSTDFRRQVDGRAVEYSLTHLGKTFIAPLEGMCQWARLHQKDITAEVDLVEARETR
jgi:DNA-binding HxlR family transcriptional regulator